MELAGIRREDWSHGRGGGDGALKWLNETFRLLLTSYITQLQLIDDNSVEKTAKLRHGDLSCAQEPNLWKTDFYFRRVKRVNGVKPAVPPWSSPTFKIIMLTNQVGLLAISSNV